MRKIRILWVLLSSILFFQDYRAAWAYQDGLPPLQGPVEMRQDESRTAAPPTERRLHEAFVRPKEGSPVRVAQAPPRPITERPVVDRPSPAARWIEGYWTWDADKNDFVWVPGVWRIPPPGKVWLAGEWKRDPDGWSRVPGTWADAPAGQPDWQIQGPPADHPVDAIAGAPGPDYFYVPGQFVPQGDQLQWKPGFWAKAQPGWEWVPSRWVRLSEGWSYREGYWDRARLSPAVVRVPAGSTPPFRSRTLVSEAMNPPLPGLGNPLEMTTSRLAARPAPDTLRVPEGLPNESGSGPPSMSTDLQAIPENERFEGDSGGPAGAQDSRYPDPTLYGGLGRAMPRRGPGESGSFDPSADLPGDRNPLDRSTMGEDPIADREAAMAGVPPWARGNRPPYPMAGQPRPPQYPPGYYPRPPYPPRGPVFRPLVRARNVVGGILGQVLP